MSSSAGDYKPPPSWLDEEELSVSSSHTLKPKGSGAPANTPSNRNLSAPSSAVLQYKKYILLGLRIATVGFSALMLMTALIGLSKVNELGDYNKMFVGIYMVCFAIMLLVFEIIQLQPMVALDHMYQRNFGFLYGIKGKGFFIIFIAFLSFGLGSDSLCILTGIALLSLGGSMVGLFLKYPDLFEEDK